MHEPEYCQERGEGAYHCDKCVAKESDRAQKAESRLALIRTYAIGLGADQPSKVLLEVARAILLLVDGKELPEAEEPSVARASKSELHLMTQRNLPYNSVRKCCEHCGLMMTPDLSWTDDEVMYRASGSRCR